MINPFAALRLQNILPAIANATKPYQAGPVNPIGMQLPEIQPTAPMMPGGNNQIGDMFAKFLQTFPQAGPPTKMQRFAGALTGAGFGPQAALQQNYLPHMQQVSNWNDQGKLLATGAASEDRQSYNEIVNYLKAQELERKRAADEARDAVANRRVDVADKNADTSVYRAETGRQNANTRQELLKGGTLHINKKDGTAWIINKVGQTIPVPDLNDLSQEELQNLQTQGRLQVVEAQGKNALDQIGARTEGAVKVKETPNGTITEGTTTVTTGPNGTTTRVTKPNKPITPVAIPEPAKKAIESFNKAQIKPGYVGVVDKDGKVMGQVPITAATQAAAEGYFIVSK